MTDTGTTTEDETKPPEWDGRRYWRRFTDGRGHWVRYRGSVGPPPGEDLAALRSGAGREPGAVPAMWRFLVWDGSDRFEDQMTPQLIAEHHALVLYGIHQQSQAHPVHRANPDRHTGPDEVAPGPDGSSGIDPGDVPNRYGLGDAVRQLHSRYSDEAVERRFYAAVVSDSVDALAMHLRGLVTQMRSLSPPATLDYERLYKDLVAWQYPASRDRVRRAWGRQYHAYHGKKADEAST